MRRAISMVLALTLGLSTGRVWKVDLAAQPPALTVAVAGTAVSKVLDFLDQKIAGIIGRAAEAASLTADAAARNAQLAANALRQQLINDLDTQWDKLEGQKLDLLKQVDQLVDTVDKSVGRVERLEELTTLDIEALLNKLPFTSQAYAIKRVEGAAQMFREDGYYRIILRSNAFDFSGSPYTLRCNQKPLRGDWLKESRQYELQITIPVSEFCGTFPDRKLAHAEIDMSIEVRNRDYAFEMWKPKTRWAYFKTTIDLFPKYPIQYRLDERRQYDVVDKNKVEWQLSQVTTIGGCGESGCYKTYNVYAYLPPGSEATGLVKECTDTFSGWGSFIKPNGATAHFMGTDFPVDRGDYCGPTSQNVQAITVAGTTVSMAFKQHSHDTSRNVQFKAGYYPLVKQSIAVDVELRDMTLGSNQDDQARLRPVPGRVVLGSGAADILGVIRASVEAVGSAVNTAAAAVQPPQGAPASKVPKAGLLRFNRTYEGQFSNDMVGYTLVAKLFTGENIVVSESKSDPRIDVKLTDKTALKRVMVTPKAPW